MTVQIAYENDDGSITTIDLLEISEKHGFSAEPTDSPVEDGSSATDGVRPELDEYSCKAFVTNAGIEETTNVNGATRVSGSIDLPSGGKLAVTQWSSSYDRPKSVYEELLALKNAKRTCIITTQLRTYDSMVITRVSAPTDTFDAIEFDIEAREVRIVQTQSAAAVPTRNVRARRTANAGTQAGSAILSTTPNAPPAAPPTRQQSLFRSLTTPR